MCGFKKGIRENSDRKKGIVYHYRNFMENKYFTGEL